MQVALLLAIVVSTERLIITIQRIAGATRTVDLRDL